LRSLITPEDFDKHPVKVIKHFDSARLAALLETNEEKISTHRLDQTTDIQARSTRSALISTGACYAIANRTEFDPDVVVTFAMLRQLGFMLVGWNYPRTYQKALATLASTGGDLEKLLTSYLGFSPLHLGLSLTVNWSTNPGLYLGCGVGVPEGLSIQSLGAAELASTKEITRVCEIGEALARVNDPEHFPAGKREWERVISDITDYVGDGGLSLIQSAIAANCESYRKVSPKLFELDFTKPRAPQTGVTGGGAKLLATNLSVKKCPEKVQEHFLAVYQEISEGQISIEGLNVLVKDLIPLCGFVRGCVYLADSGGQVLVPRLKIGESDISRYKALKSSSTKQSHPVLESLSSQIPIKQENVFMYGELVSHVTGTFGNREKVGVLYLEIGGELLQQESQVALMYFKAIKHALNDCLNLH